MFRFAEPLFFLLFIPAAAGVWFVYRRRIRSAVTFPALHRIPAGLHTWRAVLAPVLPAMTLAGLMLCIVALARPQTVFSHSSRHANVIAIQMVVDVSGTMEALDLSRSELHLRTRLEAAKTAFAEFVEQRGDDLIGLVTFGGFAVTRVPLTTDRGAVLHALKGVEVPRPDLNNNGQASSREEMMTAIGDGLMTACARLEKAEPKSRIVVLLTDGRSNAGIIEPDEAMLAARKMGIKVYTIGVGTGRRAPFKVTDAFGNTMIRAMDVEFDPERLKKIASETGGQYFQVDEPDGITRAMESIDKLEKTRVEREIYNQYRELFPWFLWPGAALVALGSISGMLTVRRLL
jgi:Ca-activated chloride channel family protein